MRFLQEWRWSQIVWVLAVFHLLTVEDGAASILVVSNANDAGPGTLRQAIIEANATPGPDEIHFGPRFFPWIMLSNALPSITDPVVIDGTTSPYWFFAPIVKLDGQWSVYGNGLTIQASNCVIKGLDIRRFNGAGLWIGGMSNVVQRCWFGIDTDRWAYNVWGVVVHGSYNLIGGTTRYAGNWISGNRSANILLRDVGTSFNQICGNIIGPDLTGQQPAPNQSIGVQIESGATDNIIGGTEFGAGNIISGLPGTGLYVSGANTVIQGNWIGLSYYGQGPLGNGVGCRVVGFGGGTVIGGADPAGRNIIAYSASAGIVVKDAANVALLGNAIYGNGGLGIDLGGDGVTTNDVADRDDGSNRLQNYPTIFSASGDGSVTGVVTSAPNASFRIEFFSNSSCDPSGYGEGESFAGTITLQTGTNGVGTFSGLVTFAPGQFFVSATATDEAGNTSEFSPCLPIANAVPRFVKGPDQMVNADAGLQFVYGWATGIDPGGPGEMFQVISFVVTNDNPALFLEQPVVDELGTLRFSPAPGSSGTAIVTVVLKDDGGTANNGHDTSDPQQFLITVLPVNHPPVAVAQFFARGILESNEFQMAIISGNRTNVQVVFDGAQSSDVDGDRLEYEWLEEGMTAPFAIGARATNFLTVGTHDVSLRVSDGILSDTDARSIIVITTSEAVRRLIQQVRDSGLSESRKRALVSVIQAALAQLERGHTRAGLVLLSVVERFVQVAIVRIDPETAQSLLFTIRPIIDAVRSAIVHNPPRETESTRLDCTLSNRYITIRWPVAGAGLRLEEKDLHKATTEPWMPVVGLYESNATHFFISLPAGSGNRLYRLSQW